MKVFCQWLTLLALIVQCSIHSLYFVLVIQEGGLCQMDAVAHYRFSSKQVGLEGQSLSVVPGHLTKSETLEIFTVVSRNRHSLY